MINEGHFLSVLHKIIYCGYSIESSQQGYSNEHPQHMFHKNICCGYSLESPQ